MTRPRYLFTRRRRPSFPVFLLVVLLAFVAMCSTLELLRLVVGA